MDEYKLQCRVFSSDFLTAQLISGRTGVRIATHDVEGEAGNVVADPADVRAFARGLLALADEVDGGEAGELTADEVVKVGDRFRVTTNYLECANVLVDDVVMVASVGSNDGFQAHRPGEEEGKWGFGLDNIGNGLERVDEPPAPPYDVKIGDRYPTWVHSVRKEDAEPVQTDNPPASSVTPERRAILEEARFIVGPRASHTEVLEYARFLAEGPR
ncbi:hypothetical protein ACFVZM_06540 [Streptomyces sioyaensis]|uniref:hypothetical protein n=1 Tax=Streptomyces sioyaensis TaxID=67364 RepID=UPI0036894E51